MEERRKAYDKFKQQKEQSSSDVNYSAFLQYAEGNELEDMSSISQMLTDLDISEQDDLDAVEQS